MSRHEIRNLIEAPGRARDAGLFQSTPREQLQMACPICDSKA